MHKVVINVIIDFDGILSVPNDAMPISGVYKQPVITKLKRREIVVMAGIDDMSSSGYSFDEVQSIAENIKSHTKIQPKIGIVCGSGLGDLANHVTNSDTICYSQIPKFPVSTVPGHDGKLVFGLLGGKPVVLMRGRIHYYEGHPMWRVAVPVRIMKALGITTVILTNAAGGLNPEYKTGDIMIIKDHIDLPGLTGECVLIGKNDERFGPRFPATVNTYDQSLQDLAKTIAEKLGYAKILRQGTYVMVGGPTFETVAESRLLRLFGADAVGMSTVPEAIVARHCGLRVFGISLITDMCPQDYNVSRATTHEEVLLVGERRAKDLQKLVTSLVEQMND
ncbi:hypothetical protein C0Q70_13415 [Pomacea canaliculata]|uniref:Purine nucleoside phosphorylase n=1 Tax=Pomacea canaliculata TaxID=400727 RepID=A0A2T7NX70_POMCA|nr:hypothetical protein C0Q70_13415 [Pomacea canaliculata]